MVVLSDPASGYDLPQSKSGNRRVRKQMRVSLELVIAHRWTRRCGFTKSGVDVAEDSGGLHVDGMDVGNRLHLDTVLQQQLLDLLGLSQDGHFR